MLLGAICFLFSFIDVISPFQFSSFNRINQHSKAGNIMEFSEGLSHPNEVVDCRLEDILNIIALDDLQRLIEGLASRTAISPFLILRKLNKRMFSRDGVNEILIDSFDGSPLTEAPAQTVFELPLEAPYSVSPHSSGIDMNEDKDIVIVPVVPSSMNRMKLGHVFTNDNDGEMSNMLPGVFLPSIKHNRFKPPLGATVHVDCGDPRNPVTREITVTVSPLMTFIEVLRQVERKYQTLLGMRDDTEIITFVHSPAVDCYVINGIADIVQNELSGWKVTVRDRDSQVVYDNFCLPNNNDVLVKPGSEISLSYVFL